MSTPTTATYSGMPAENPYAQQMPPQVPYAQQVQVQQGTMAAPPPGYGTYQPPPQMPAQAQPVIVGQPQVVTVMPPHQQVVVVQQNMRAPMQCQCPNCRRVVVSNLKFEPNGLTFLACIGICLIFWPCACVPFCIDDCKTAVHTCPICNTVLATNG